MVPRYCLVFDEALNISPANICGCAATCDLMRQRKAQHVAGLAVSLFGGGLSGQNTKRSMLSLWSETNSGRGWARLGG